MAAKHQCEATVVRSKQQCKRYTRPGEQFCSMHHRAVAEKPNTKDSPILGECAICLEGVAECDDCGLECKHCFHRNCITQMKLSANCPMCRAPINNSKLSKSEMERLDKQIEEERVRKLRETEERDRQLAMRLSRLTQAHLRALLWLARDEFGAQ